MTGAILRSVFKAIGWQKLLLMVWKIIKIPAQEYVDKTPNKVDDAILETMDEIIQFASSMSYKVALDGREYLLKSAKYSVPVSSEGGVV